MAFPTGWNKKHKITIDNTKVSGSSNLSNFPVLLTESNFLSDVFSNSQGKEIYTNYLYNDANLQGYWRLENNWNDSSSNGYNLTASGSPTFTTAMFGYGASLAAASSQYASIADASCPNLEITGSRTVSAWIKLNSTSGSVIVSKDGGAGNFYQILRTATDVIRFRCVGLTTNDTVDSDVVINTGEWYHVCGVYDSTAGKLKVFVNGHKTEVSASGSSNDTNGDFYIGRNSAGNYWDGVIDDVAVWDRALSDEEVLAIFTGGADIRFSTDVSGTNQIPHEVVSWDIDNSKAEVWVKVPTLYYNIDTTIYVWYSNSSAAPLARTDTYGSDNVWNGYRAVYHMHSSYDSSANQYNLTGSVFPTFAPAKVGNGGGYDGSTDGPLLGNSNVSWARPATLSFWVKPTLDATLRRWIDNNNATFTTTTFTIRQLADDTTQVQHSSTTESSFTGITSGAWSKIDVLVNSADFDLYVDTTQKLASVSNSYTLDTSLYVGSGYGTGERFNGVLDEVRMYNGTLTTDWLITEYNNQDSPSTFSIPSEADREVSVSESVSTSESVSVTVSNLQAIVAESVSLSESVQNRVYTETTQDDPAYISNLEKDKPTIASVDI